MSDTAAPKRPRGRPRKNPAPVEPEPLVQAVPAEPAASKADEFKAFATAIADAIRGTQPFVKKTQFNKPSVTAWTPKDGSPQHRLKRKSYHHGMLIGDPTEPETRMTNEEIDLFNKIKPGTYCNGFVKVIRRRDKGIDIDYPVRTASQRLRLVNDFGIRSFAELLQRCVDEAARPKAVAAAEDDD